MRRKDHIFMQRPRKTPAKESHSIVSKKCEWCGRPADCAAWNHYVAFILHVARRYKVDLKASKLIGAAIAESPNGRTYIFCCEECFRAYLHYKPHHTSCPVQSFGRMSYEDYDPDAFGYWSLVVKIAEEAAV